MWLVLGTIAVGACAPLSAAPSEVDAQAPEVVGRGLAAYADEGADAAIRAWIAGGPLDTPEFAAVQASGLRRIESFYGRYQAAELIRAEDITPRLKAVYIALYFERGPAFCYMLCYQTATGDWVVGDFDGSTSPRRILPEYGATAPPLFAPPSGTGEAPPS